MFTRFPIYRTHIEVYDRSMQDREVFRYAAEVIREDLDEVDRMVLDHLRRRFGGQPPRELLSGPLRRLRDELPARFQRLSSPTAAKAVKDTVCYRSATLLSRNDAGFDPQRFAIPAGEFHATCGARRLAGLRALLATVSHDHKHGEDICVHLAAFSELVPWSARNVEYWQSLATPLYRDLVEGPTPGPGDKLILLQALFGSWSFDTSCDGAALDQVFLARIRE